jgi:hypothetical protein
MEKGGAPGVGVPLAEIRVERLTVRFNDFEMGEASQPEKEHATTATNGRDQ